MLVLIHCEKYDLDANVKLHFSRQSSLSITSDGDERDH